MNPSEDTPRSRGGKLIKKSIGSRLLKVKAVPKTARGPMAAKAAVPRKNGSRLGTERAFKFGWGTELMPIAQKLSASPPIERVDVEQRGVPAEIVSLMAHEMDISHARLWRILNIPKATADRKMKLKDPVTGASGHTAVAMMNLLDKARKIVEDSTAEGAKDFDVPKWFGEWIEIPQPALAGRTPAEVMSTPTGAEAVARVLGSIASGAYL